MTACLNLSAWPQWLFLSRLWDAFDAAGEELWLVGGCVRDALLGYAVHDLDLATTAVPERTAEILCEAGLRAIPTGIAHGTVTAVFDQEGHAKGSSPEPASRQWRATGKEACLQQDSAAPLREQQASAGGIKKCKAEITTLRRDVACDGRHAEVAYTRDRHEDARRRDFTINALFAGRDGAVQDDLGGLADLEAGRVRFIGEPRDRITEDALRILRFFRFSARFAVPPYDAAGLAACAERAATTAHLSGERVWGELSRLLAFPAPEAAVAAMAEGGIWSAALGVAADALAFSRLRPLEDACVVSPDALRRLAALVPEGATEAVAERLRLSRAERKTLETLVLAPFEPRQLARMGRVYGTATAADMLLVRVARGAAQVPDVPAAVAWLSAWQPPVFPLTGADVLALGIAPGPRVGEVLGRMESVWERSGYTIDREGLLQAARRFVQDSSF